MNDTPFPASQPPTAYSSNTQARATRAKERTGGVVPSSVWTAQSPPSPQLHPRAGSGSPSRIELTPNHLHEPNTEPLSHPIRSTTAEIATLDSSPGLGLEDLKLQIDLLSTEIVAFSAERDALKRMLTEALPQVCPDRTRRSLPIA